MEAGDGKPVWSSCCLSPSFSISLTWGFRLLTCLGGRMCVCVCVCVCWAGHSSSFFYGLSYIYRVFYLRVASSMFYMLALPFRIFCSCYFVG